MKPFVGLVLGATLLSLTAPAIAHHSYSMFDLNNRSSLEGTVAKVEWTNPHVIVWVYVKNAKGTYDLYGLEGGAITLLTRYGWTKDSVKAGETVKVDYFPLKDKRPGGAFINFTHADGSVTRNEPFAPGGSDPSAYSVKKPAEAKK